MSTSAHNNLNLQGHWRMDLTVQRRLDVMLIMKRSRLSSSSTNRNSSMAIMSQDVYEVSNCHEPNKLPLARVPQRRCLHICSDSSSDPNSIYSSSA
eukprot:21407-Heterococcus_DN1.PRE.1